MRMNDDKMMFDGQHKTAFKNKSKKKLQEEATV